MRAALPVLLLVLPTSLAAQPTLPPCLTPPFDDIDITNPFCPWIQQLKVDEITSTDGCGGGKYCPDNPVTRQQLAMLLENAVRGTDTFKVDAGTLDGLDSSQLQRRFAKVAMVAKSSTGDYASPVDAITNLATWCGVPAPSNHCLIFIWPGVYNLPGPLSLPSQVSLAGPGGSMVILSRTGNADPSSAVVVAQGDGLVSGLSIQASASTHAVGLRLADNSTRLVSRVSVIANTGTTTAIAVRVADAAFPTLEDCQLAAYYGPTTKGLDIGGTASVATVRRTTVAANGFAGTETCVGVEVSANNSFDLRDVAASAVDCGTGFALRTAGPGTVRGGTMEALGSATTNTAVGQLAGSDLVLDDVRATATSAAAVALAVGGFTTKVSNSQLFADVALDGTGNDISVIEASSLLGDLTDDGSTGTSIGSSRIGTITGTGLYRCANSHDLGFNELGSDCLIPPP